MSVIYLTRGQETVVDSEDFDLADFNWYALKNNLGGCYYARRVINSGNGKRSTILLHRVILERKLERKLLLSEIVDHIDRDGLNNRRDNLRLATHSENNRNSKKPKNNRSGFKGVHFRKDRNMWESQIKYDGKMHHLGLFKTPEEAHETYCEKAKELFGEFFNPG